MPVTLLCFVVSGSVSSVDSSAGTRAKQLNHCTGVLCTHALRSALQLNIKPGFFPCLITRQLCLGCGVNLRALLCWSLQVQYGASSADCVLLGGQ